MQAGPETDKAASPWPAEKARLGIGLVLIVLVGLATLPGLYLPFGPPGIDPGWRWAVNQARSSGHLFGRDLVFTYGPLGYLLSPLDINANLLVANWFLAGTHCCLFAAVLLLFRRRRRLGPLLLFLVIFTYAARLGLATEGRLLITAGLLAYLAVSHSRLPPLLVASCLAGVYLLAKMSLGLAALLMVIVAVLLLCVTRRCGLPLLALVPGGVVLALLAWLLIGSPLLVVQWLQLSLQVVSGYSVANSITGPISQLVVGVVAVVGWAVAAVLTRRERDLLVLNLILAPVMLVQLRIAFVRQDDHQLQFLPFVLAVLAVTCLAAPQRRQLSVCSVAVLLLLATGIPVGLLPASPGSYLPFELLSFRGVAKLVPLVNPAPLRELLARQSAENLQPLQLPEQWVGTLRGSHNGVGTLPWENQYCPANDLAWNPTPTLQLYSAYTRRLDLWSASHYAGERAPEYILNEYMPVGKRHQMLDAPATWREIFQHYLPRAALNRPQLALLERRAEPLTCRERQVAHGRVPLGGKPVPVPVSQHLLFAEIDLRFNLLGHLQRSLFRVPLVYLVLHHASGHVTYYRLIPGTAPNGVLINRFPRDFYGYLQLWSGVTDDPVVRFAITGPGVICFKPQADITWQELQIVD